MEISDIRIRKILQEGRLRAVISLTIDNAVAVHDIKLVQGDDRMFVAMPSRRDEAGLFRDIIHPINPEARALLEKRILEAYDKYVSAEAANAAAPVAEEASDEAAVEA
ncbi:MAG: SpoVG family protein [Oscillospiraceae bacterium]|nr:SpoVG family protein [Oscillospiraceae bacterium]